MSGVVYLSPSRALTWEACKRQYWYQYILRWKPSFESATLLYGSAIHLAIEMWLRGLVLGHNVDAGAVFSKAYLDSVAGKRVQYTDDWDETSLIQCGLRSLAEFQKEWIERGYQPFIDLQGEPVLEREIAVDIGCGVILRMKMDCLALTPEILIKVIDWKTPKQAAPEGFALVADQTLAYQLGVEAIGPELGFTHIDGVGFVEIFKKKRGASVSFDQETGRRPNGQVEEYVKKLQGYAEEIRSSNFYPRKAGQAFGSPCGLCNFRSHCHKGEYEGIDMESVQKSMESNRGRQLSLVPTVRAA